MNIFENVNVRNENYEIGDIIRSFLSQTEGQTHQQYGTSRISNDGIITPSKLCYEASKKFSNYEDVTGLSFCFGGIRPYYIVYRGLLCKDSLVISTGVHVMRNFIEKGKGQKCIIPYADPYVVESYMYDLTKDVDNLNEYIGQLVTRNYNNCIIVDNMSIRISHNDLTQGITDQCGKNVKATKLDLYLSIGKRISEKRKNGKDLNWFMYKMLLLNKIM